jgi:FdhE protein
MNRWDRRIARAAELGERYPAAAQLLRFYRDLASFQSDPRIGPNVSDHLPALLDLVRRKGTPVLIQHAAEFAAHPERWDGLPDQADDPLFAFFHRAIRQPYLERQALQSKVNTSAVQSTCPFCFESPVAAVLRPEGDGGRRTLLCGLCFTEWEFRRLLCPACGEEEKEKLPVYTSADFPHIRIEACDTCRHYIKAIDLTRDGNAIPEVDEIAALPLDLWAVEHGYRKVARGLFG